MIKINRSRVFVPMERVAAVVKQVRISLLLSIIPRAFDSQSRTVCSVEVGLSKSCFNLHADETVEFYRNW